MSSYGLHAVDFGSSADKVFAALDRHPFVAGEFVWTGFLTTWGPTPYYDSRSSYCGIFDLAGFAKDRAFLTSRAGRPTSPWPTCCHWTWPERVGRVTPVHAFTSGDEAELFLNGRSLGRKKKGAFGTACAGTTWSMSRVSSSWWPIAKASLGPLTSSAPLAPQPACCSAWTAARSATMGGIWPS